jgi:hypothetical protein
VGNIVWNKKGAGSVSLVLVERNISLRRTLFIPAIPTHHSQVSFDQVSCGATSLTDRIEVHHIRALKDLEKYPGREKPRWVKIMAARRRKTLILCRTCHQDVQYGRPLRRRKSDS